MRDASIGHHRTARRVLPVMVEVRSEGPYRVSDLRCYFCYLRDVSGQVTRALYLPRVNGRAATIYKASRKGDGEKSTDGKRKRDREKGEEVGENGRAPRNYARVNYDGTAVIRWSGRTTSKVSSIAGDTYRHQIRE